MFAEHLIPQNLEVTRKAKELFGFRRFYTDRCKTYVNVNGKDVPKTLAKLCREPNNHPTLKIWLTSDQ